MKLPICIPRAFDGPRNSRLRLLWELWAEAYQKSFVLRWYSNPRTRLSHAQMFQRIWETERDRPEPYVVLTEADFLPSSAGILTTVALMQDHKIPAIGTRYVTRNAQTGKLISHPHVGGWFLILHKASIPRDLVFEGRPDPCNQLNKQIPNIQVFAGMDCHPDHFGVSYVTGTHLFFSRHLDDPPSTSPLPGLPASLKDIQDGHDRAVAAYVRAAPLPLRRVIKKRAPELLDVACAR